MFAVIVCSLFNLFMTAGLLAAIVAGFWRGRGAIGEALALAPPGHVRPAAPRWQSV